jgi:protein-tyrosine phosphatase
MMTELSTDRLRLHPVAVERTGPDSVRIHWNPDAADLPVTVFSGPAPDAIGTEPAAVAAAGENAVTIAGLAAQRPVFFRLAAGAAPGILVGERCLPVEGVTNLRDLGGYAAADGRRVRWGTVYRSANLGRVTTDGLAALRQLGLRLVCDFRTEPESTKLPNLFPDSPEIAYLRLPIQHGDHEPTAVFERIRNGDYHWISEEFMLEGYIEGIDRYPHVWARFVRELSRAHNRPTLFHCTGGKDRTGAAAALTLLALGVAEETVVEDFGLSDTCNLEVRRRVYGHLRQLNVDISTVEPYFTAPASRLRALLEHMRRTYGSAEDYLVHTAGVEPGVIDALRNALLE